MHLSWFTSVFAATLALGAVIERDTVERDVEERAVKPRTCGSNDPPQALVEQAALFAAQTGPKPQAHAPIVVNTYFHVVTSSSKQGLYSQTQLNNEVRCKRYLVRALLARDRPLHSTHSDTLLLCS